jgi:endonuclease G, mitochondrial
MQESLQESLKVQDANRIIDIMADLAVNFDVPAQFFKSLVSDAELPKNWFQELGQWPPDNRIAAQRLIKWAEAKGINPNNKNFYTLGCILQALFSRVGFDKQSVIAAVMVRYGLIQSERLLNDLIVNYQVPISPEMTSAPKNYGPEIDWRGPTDELQLQSLFKPQPDFLDVGFLIEGIRQAISVCRIETSAGKALGTGFLIDNNLLLTNYHVLQTETSTPDNINANAREIVLRFGYFTAETGGATKGQTFRLEQNQPMVQHSPTDKLDYVLLRVEDKIIKTSEIKKAECEFNNLLAERMTLAILQHPDGESMKLAVSSDGITSVQPQTGLVQYLTRTSGGSSGSPCFNENWKVVALHHAERAKAFGSIREGILLSAIYPEIKSHLNI